MRKLGRGDAWRPAVPRAPALVLMLACSLACVAVLAAAASGEEASTPAPKAPPAPANDALSGAQQVHTLPASLDGTTVGASTEPGEVESGCRVPTKNSVWYSVRLSTAHRVALDLAAAGALDATIDVYHAVRSQLTPVACQQTEGEGKASLSFQASKNGLYDIRVAALQSSQLATFSLEVFLPTPAVAPPGPPLPPQGASGQVDRIQNINAAYSFVMHSGTSYMINLANETKGGCVTGSLFAPGTRSFGSEGEESEEGSSAAVLRIHCSGFRLFTPGPGEGGLYSLELTPRFSRRGVQRFRVQVGRAGAAETSPGIALGNYGVARGHLNGDGLPVLRLYRMEITSHSNLTLKLTAPASAEFKLQLRNANGNLIECACEGAGSQKLAHRLSPGTYYADVSARAHNSGSFSLLRESRTITSTAISFTSRKVTAGQSLGIDVKVSPEVSGPVSVRIERFDPVFGWQFYRKEQAIASAGLASVPFVPPALGMWRAKANFLGSRTASPSAVGFTYLLVG
jgi:hypothetical protein